MEGDNEECLGMEELVKDEDMLLLKMLDIRDIRGEEWDDWRALRGLLVEEL